MDDTGDAENVKSASLSPAAAGHLTLGVIVPCYSPERLEDILKLLDSIERQTSPIDGIVVVVQQSRELLAAIDRAVTGLTRSHVRLLFLDVASGVCRARNAGLRVLETDIIAFVDDDAVLSADWAEATRLLYLQRPDAIGIAGAILPEWDSPAMTWFPRELYWMLSCTYWTGTAPRRVRNGYGANMSFRREAFDDGRCFNESIGIAGWGTGGWRGMGGEEPDLALRVTAATGGAVLYAPGIRAWHRVRRHRLAWRSLVRRAYWDGRFKAALSRWPASKSDVLDTERSLLAEIVRAQAARLRLLSSHPLVALRQEFLVLLVVVVVGFGFVEGRLKRSRAGDVACM